MNKALRIGLINVVCAGLLMAGCAASDQEAEADRSAVCQECNVLLVSIDTLRADHLSLYGYSRPTAPNLEKLAAEGVVFDQMVNAGGGTLPSHMSMMTSLRPLTHNVRENNDRVLEAERITLAEQLEEAGFSTAAFTDGGYVNSKYGFSQGFDIYDDAGGGLESSLPKARAWLEGNRASRFFLFLHTYDVHSKSERHQYDCTGYNEYYTGDYSGDFDGCLGEKCASQLFLWINKEIKKNGKSAYEFLTQEDVDLQEARYDGCINYVDDQLWGFFDAMRSLGVYENTLILVTSDHGEEFLDHGFLLHTSAYWEHMMRVPLVVRFPRSRYGGNRVSGLATTIDIMPTVLEVLGIPLNRQAQGVSLMPAVRDGSRVRRAINIFGGIRTERWKYIPGGYLYDLREDPAEQNNLVKTETETAARLQAAGREAKREDELLHREFVQRVADDGRSVGLTEEELERLRALGYVD